MEMELEPRVKPLAYKVKATSRESPSQKAAHVLDTDLRNHWSTTTNTKEWILLELDEPCLLSHIRIYNKSVLEWEIVAGLRYKPETFVKVRPRCEAPRRDVMYPMNYTPCRYVRISCLRGNPIAIFFIQLIGITVMGLEPEFQPVINHLLPHILSHRQDARDMHLQLLEDMVNRLLVFVPQLESELSSFSDAADSNLRFLAMLTGPCYPLLHIVNERECARTSGNISDAESQRNSLSLSASTVSSNFQPRRSRNGLPFSLSSSNSIAFRRDVIFVLLRRAYKDSNLGILCGKASGILQKLIEPISQQETSVSSNDVPSVLDGTCKPQLVNHLSMDEYTTLFGEDFQIPTVQSDSGTLNILDVGAVEEGILHVLYGCASQPLLCSKLAEITADFWSTLPLVQALLPALHPHISRPSEPVDESFSQWKQPFVQQALSQVVAAAVSPVYQPLVRACAGYLASFSPFHAKAACLLIDLCSNALAPWVTQVIAKVDLAVELLEDLVGTIQGAHHSMALARAALKYIVLALSGHVDDILGKYKEAKHKILFLVEMLEPFLDPSVFASKSRISFGDLSFAFLEKKEQVCLIAVNVIRIAAQKPAVLPSLESEWRRGAVAPSVLLSILEPGMQLPPEIDLCKSPDLKDVELDSTPTSKSSALRFGGALKSHNQDNVEGKMDVQDTAVTDVPEDVSFLFAPPEIRNITLTSFFGFPGLDLNQVDVDVGQKADERSVDKLKDGLVLDAEFSAEYNNLQADYLQLVNFRDCELKASEFQRLAVDLHSQVEISVEGHDAAIEALLLAAECYVNPFFLTSHRPGSDCVKNRNINSARTPKVAEFSDFEKAANRGGNLATVIQLEKKRDKIVLKILLEAAELDRNYCRRFSGGEMCPSNTEESHEDVIKLSPLDLESADAVTLVRQNQPLLCNFIIKKLQEEKHSTHEVLLQCLVFLLHSGTKLHCSAETVIDIILKSADHLNEILTSLYHQLKEGKLQLNPEKIYEIQRHWILLQKLIIASSGGGFGSDFLVSFSSCFRHGNLIRPSAWMCRISTFSHSSSPLVRFLGWMAVSRNAKQFLKEQGLLTADLSELTDLVSIFMDELAAVGYFVYHSHENLKHEQAEVKQESSTANTFKDTGTLHADQSFRVMHPDLCEFIPNMIKQFNGFGEVILEAVGLHLRSLPSSALPDILCWFSDLCSCPFFTKHQPMSQIGSDCLKGYASKNAKAVILYLLDSVVLEHMEAMVPEIPRVVQVLVSLISSSYCDISFLDSVLHLLKPIISFSLCRVSDEEKSLVDDTCLNFESLCFDELFINIRQRNEDDLVDNSFSRPLTIFILGSVFPDLSFTRKREMLLSLALWTNFTSESTTSLHDFLCAFDAVMKSCNTFLVQTLNVFGYVPLHMPHFSSSKDFGESGSISLSQFLNDLFPKVSTTETSKQLEASSDAVIPDKKNYSLSEEEMKDFVKNLENLIFSLLPSLEECWEVHFQLAKKLTITAAECLVYSRCLSSVPSEIRDAKDEVNVNYFQDESVNQLPAHWNTSLEGLAETVVTLQKNHCWAVGSVVLDCLLGVPLSFPLNTTIHFVCSGIKTISRNAPKLAWRLQSNKWLSMLFSRGIDNLQENEISHIIGLFQSMLNHPEPEQRVIALQQLGKLLGQDFDGGITMQQTIFKGKTVSTGIVHSDSEKLLSLLVLSTWDQVAVLASSDTSFFIRTCAMALLVEYIPYTERQKLRSFLASADSLLLSLGSSVSSVCSGPLLQLSLALIAGACLYCPVEDISLIPENIWENIETLGFSRAGRRLSEWERKACQVLFRLKNEGDDAKEVLKEAFLTSPTKQFDPEFGSTRESILQVLSNLTTVQSYFDVLRLKSDQETLELEEAEIELDVISKESDLLKASKDSSEVGQIPLAAFTVKDVNRLQQIKDHIRSLERSKLREQIVARHQKRLLMRRARLKYLEDAALREAALLQELDRERVAEVEKEIERQHLLELERAKTRELHHNLDMEKERQMQRELQLELEQADSGLRSRRDFSSSQSSRPRERFRERENGRSANEGSSKTAGAVGSLQPEISTTSSSMAPVPTVVLSGSRSFSSQPPTILQSRDRGDEGSSSYEENLDGSKDSGDTGSIGDLESVFMFDGQSSSFGSAQRHGSRGSKSRQVLERRERDGRREGKWERKH